MLPAESRLRRTSDFTVVTRAGRRVRRPALVLHAALPAPAGEPVAGPTDAASGTDALRTRGQLPAPYGTSEYGPPRVGFIVSKAVGTAVVRNLVTRRLRHLMRDRLAGLPQGARVVVRALPAAAQTPSQQLGADLDVALDRLLSAERRVAVRSRAGR